MILYYHEAGIIGRNPLIPVVCRIFERLFIIGENSLFIKKMDEKSNKHAVESPLRCAVFGCFDKDNICCKACDVKKCRYKCNFADKEVCEHQFI